MKPLLIPLFILGLAACEKKPVDNSFGPPTSSFEIQDAQNKALSKLDPYTVKKGQRVHQIETQEVISSQGPAKFLSKEWVTEVRDVEDFTSERLLTTHKSVRDRVWDESFVYEFKSVYSLPQVASLNLLDQLDQKRYQLSSLISQLAEQGQVRETDIDGVAFHNLREQKVVLVPPQLVKDAENCKNLKKCQIQADLITYDIVFLMTDGSTQSHNVEWMLSADVPFFAALLKQCATTVLPVENLRVLVKQCIEVVDFDQ